MDLDGGHRESTEIPNVVTLALPEETYDVINTMPKWVDKSDDDETTLLKKPRRACIVGRWILRITIVGGLLANAILFVHFEIQRSQKKPKKHSDGNASMASKLRSLDLEVLTVSDDAFATTSRMMNVYVRNPGSVIVEARKTEDVRRAVVFAKTQRLRITVFATGHDYAGRSNGKGSLNINVAKMQFVRIYGDIAEIGPGTPWSQVYEAALPLGLVPVSGYDPTVGVSGFTLGGGHGPLSRRYGLGADQLLGATVVLANGTVVDADDELLWALRGGGSGFGVVTNFRIQLHPAPTTLFHFSFEMDLLSPDLFRRFYHNASWWRHLDVGWSAYSTIHCSDDGNPYLMGEFLYTGYQNRSLDDVRALRSLLKNPKVRQWTTIQKFIDEGMDIAGTGHLGSKGASQFINNVFIDDDHLNDELTDIILDTMTCSVPRESNLFFFYNFVLGGAVQSAQRAHSAVSPGFRDAVFEVGPNTYWFHDADAKKSISASTDAAQQLSAFAPSSYVNEWTGSIPDWRDRFWGRDNYARLLDIKHRLDVCNLFWIPYGVAADEPSFASAGC